LLFRRIPVWGNQPSPLEARSGGPDQPDVWDVHDCVSSLHYLTTGDGRPPLRRPGPPARPPFCTCCSYRICAPGVEEKNVARAQKKIASAGVYSGRNGLEASKSRAWRDMPISCKTRSLRRISSLCERVQCRHSAKLCFTLLQRDTRRGRTVIITQSIVLMARSTWGGSTACQYRRMGCLLGGAVS